VAREKPGGHNLEVTIGDMSRVTTGRTYRLVYLVYNTIGNLLTQDEQVRCFKNAAPARPGRQFVDAEQIAVGHVMLEVGSYDPVTQILDLNHIRIGADGITLSRSACGWPNRPSSIS
jgi:hypothetical protein